LPGSIRGMALKNLGLSLLESGNPAEAETALLAALVQSPPDFRAYCSLSKVYRENGQIEKASLAEAECRKLTSSEDVAL
jgi:predicted Zn-dependent protease